MAEKLEFYDGTKLLSLKDIDGETPAIFVSTGGRGVGKTTKYNKMAVNRFKKGKGKFLLLYRWLYELSDVAEKFFKDIKELFFPEDTMSEKIKAKGHYVELKLNDAVCGYAVAVNDANTVKKLSHFFNDVTLMLFDEFVPEDGRYCPRELDKLQSIYSSIARGHGEPCRYVQLIMISNKITLMNPYFEEWGFSCRIQNDTKYLRGRGVVLESYSNEEISQRKQEAAFSRAFSGSKYQAYANTDVYLNDNLTFIETIKEQTEYVCTVSYKGQDFAIRKCIPLGVLYCDKNVDKSYPVRLALTTADMRTNYILMENFGYLIQQLRTVFNQGAFRFKDLACKECVFELIGHRYY